MNLYELDGSENHPVYQEMMTSNYARHYDFLFSVIQSAMTSNRTWLSESIIKALNHHAIVALHDQAGQYRTVEVEVRDNGVPTYTPPESYRVRSLMEDFVNDVNWHWQSVPAVKLAAYAMWRVNSIHPFVNGNGRTARAVCYFILCLRAGFLLPGKTIMPELMRQEPLRAACVSALQVADQGHSLTALENLIMKAVTAQVYETQVGPLTV